MDHINVARIEVHAKLSATIDSCIRESIELAFKEGHDVKLIHKGKIYLIVIKDLLEGVKQAIK